ncbi:ABC transporter ATP-binding protein, partial [bacterium]|nr:ABC transporter ATP-binding protein [bacterium]
SDISQWERWFRASLKASRATSAASTVALAVPIPPESTRKKRLSYKEQLEFDRMEGVILELESELSSLQVESGSPEVASHAVRLTEISGRMGGLQSEIERLYARWAELEAKVRQ